MAAGRSTVGWTTATVLSVALAMAGVAVVAQRGGQRGVAQQVPPGQCPPGTTEVRPGRCQAPEFPPPSIVDYKPRSTLVTARHPVPRAKFPVVDIHSHTGPTPETVERLIEEMDALNLRVLTNLSGGSDPGAVKQKVDYIRASKYPDRFRVFASVDWNGAGAPGWARGPSPTSRRP